MNNYIYVEVKRTATYVINKSLDEIDLSNFNNIYNGEYYTKYGIDYTNKLKKKISNKIQKNFSNVEKGLIVDNDSLEIYDKNKYKYVNKGYLCEISFGSIVGSSLFSNIGPTIPIKIVFVGDTYVNIEFETKNYGINNVIVKTYLIVEVLNKASMPIGSKDCKITIKEPIGVEIIKGKVPNYYNVY